MNKKRKKPLFLVRPRLVSGENVEGYLQRLGKANGLANHSQTLAAIGVPLSHIITSGHSKLQEVINGDAPPDSLRIDRQNSDFPRIRVIKSTGLTYARVCVNCLKTSDILSPAWCYPLSISCQKHQHQLLDHCPHCKRRILRRKSQYKCECGMAFVDHKPTATPVWEKSFYELFAPWRLERTWACDEADILRHEIRSAQALRRINNISGDFSKTTVSTLNWIFSSDYEHIDRLCSTCFSSSPINALVSSILKRLWWRQVRQGVRYTTSVPVLKAEKTNVHYEHRVF